MAPLRRPREEPRRRGCRASAKILSAATLIAFQALLLTHSQIFLRDWYRGIIAGVGTGLGERGGCGLYLAPSSVPGAGMGVYAGVDVPIGSFIDSPQVVIQHHDHERHMSLRRELARSLGGEEEEDDDDPVPEWMLDEYYWESRNARGIYDSDRPISFIPGLGMMANSHGGLSNARHASGGRPPMDGAGLHRSEDPGVGAFSDVYGYRYEARGPRPTAEVRGDEEGGGQGGSGSGLIGGKIPAGMEIFVDCEFQSRRARSFVPSPRKDPFVPLYRSL